MKRFTLHVQRFAAASGALALLLTNAPPADACTIAVLTDGERVLFANNEDWSNPDTRIWFVPAAGGKHGAVFVGFDACSGSPASRCVSISPPS